MRRGATKIAVGGVLLALAGAARADYPQSFKDGIRSKNFGKWPEVVSAMRLAILQSPRSTGELVRITGMEFEPYVPHYFLGLGLYRQGDCDGAAAAFCEAEAQGTTRGIYRARLDLYQDVCAQRIGRRPCVARPASAPAPTPSVPRPPHVTPPTPVPPSPDPGPPPSSSDVRKIALDKAVREGRELVAKGERLAQQLKQRRLNPQRQEMLAVANRRLQSAAFQLEGCRREGDIEGAQRARDDAQATWEMLDELIRGA